MVIFCEGDSAKAGIISGLSSEDRNIIGVYPMKGKILNVRGENIKKISENKEIAEIKKILGLETGKEYKTIEQIKDHTIIIDGITKIDTDAFLLQMKEVKNILKAILDEDFNQLTQTVRNQNSINLSNEELNQIISTNPDIINLLSSVNDMIKTRSELNDDNKRKIIELKGIYGTACPFVDEDLQKIINMCELDIKQREEEIKNNTLILDGIKQLRENLQSILSSSSRPQSKIHEIISLVNTIFNTYLKKD